MKKTYMIPDMEVLEIASNQQLMAGSPGLGGDLGSTDPILGREDFLLWEEDN